MTHRRIPLEIKVSLPEGFAESIADMVRSRFLDLIPVLAHDLSRDLVTLAHDETTGRADDLIVTTWLPVADFDAEFAAALRAFRLDLHERIVRHREAPTVAYGAEQACRSPVN
ncbi:hypothetical protein [Asaia bogorensis]|uniref:hypothetical protein n=1 Tax=Asaia bogorensis TaxID=91915 RepID=UPI000EFCAF39|nr:hypothetical protein [Asaia bogorensis]